MADQTLNFVLKASNTASPELTKVAADIQKVVTATKSTQGDLVAWGNAWGTAAARSKAASDQAAGGFGGLETAAKDAVKGGLRDILSEVPIVGGVLSKLATNIGGTTLALGGLAAVGLAALKFLQNLESDATKALDASTAFAEGIGAGFRQTVLEVEKIRAEASGEHIRALELDAEKEIAAAEAVKNQKIAKAKEELTQLDLFGRQRTELSTEALREIEAAEAEFANKVVITNTRKTADLAALEKERAAFHQSNLAALVEAEAAAQQAILEGQGKQLEALDANLVQQKAKAQESLTAFLSDLETRNLTAAQKLEERRLGEAKFQADVVKLEQDAADARKRITESLTSSALDIFTKLGSGFEDIVQKLQLAQFAEATQSALQTLQQRLDAGIITQEQFARGTQGLTTKLQEAVSLGFVPTTEAATKQTEAFTVAGETAKTVGESIAASLFAAGAAAEDTISILDALIAKGKAAQAAVSGSAVGGGMTGGTGQVTGAITGAGITGDFILDSTVLGSIANQSSGSGLTPFSSSTTPVLGPGQTSGTGGGGIFAGSGLSTPAPIVSPWVNVSPSETFQHGGQIPIIAHPGELVGQPETLVTAFMEALTRMGVGRGDRMREDWDRRATIRMEPGAVTIHAIDGRHFEDFVEVLAQRLDERTRRRGY